MWSKCSLFSFCFGKERVGNFANSVRFGKYIFSYDANTPVTVVGQQEREVLLFGYAVHVEKRFFEQSLLTDMLEQSMDLQSLIRYESNLGGKYVLLYHEGDRYYALPDATASIPLFYMNTEEDILLTSHSQSFVDFFSLQPDDTLLKIRRSGDISQAMPYDVTEYAGIKQLLPNHYLNILDGVAIRFLNAEHEQAVLSPEEAVEATASKIAVLTEYYTKRFKIYCPITGGKDSRVVLSFLLTQASEPIDAYTIRHSYHKGTEIDLTTPLKIAETVNIRYRQISDLQASSELVEFCDTMLGKERYSQNTLMIANTIQQHYGDGAIINGDIIGQIGKCSLHRDIPLCLATPGYFRCKLHNYSRESKWQLKQWLKEIKRSGECVNSFDLFSIENRMGRWAGQTNLIYNTVGLPNLNVFNCRSIIYTFTQVPRKFRKNSEIHRCFLNRDMNGLVNISFLNDENWLIYLSKMNGVFFYTFSYFKFFYEKMMFLMKKKGKNA